MFGNFKNDVLTNCITNGKIVVTTSFEFFYNNISSLAMVSFLETADYFAIYNDIINDRYACCSIDAGSFEKSTDMLKKWICGINNVNKSDDIIIKSNTGLSQWGTEYHFELYKYYDDYGWLNNNTSYFPLNEDNTDYNYYYAKYDIQCVPDNNRYTSKINVYSKLYDNQKILDYAPTTTSNASTVGVNIGVSSDGVVSAGLNWSYSASDVTIIDHTNYGTNEFSIEHGIDKKTPASFASYTVKPGKVVRVDCGNFTKTGNYIGNDQYDVVFAKEVKSGIFGKTTWEYKTFSETIGIFCYSNPHTLTIMPNGADE